MLPKSFYITVLSKQTKQDECEVNHFVCKIFACFVFSIFSKLGPPTKSWMASNHFRKIAWNQYYKINKFLLIYCVSHFNDPTWKNLQRNNLTLCDISHLTSVHRSNFSKIAPAVKVLQTFCVHIDLNIIY